MHAPMHAMANGSHVKGTSDGQMVGTTYNDKYTQRVSHRKGREDHQYSASSLVFPVVFLMMFSPVGWEA